MSHHQLGGREIDIGTSGPFSLLLPTTVTGITRRTNICGTAGRPLGAFCLTVATNIFVSVTFIFCVATAANANAVPFNVTGLINNVYFSLKLVLYIIYKTSLFASAILVIITGTDKHVA